MTGEILENLRVAPGHFRMSLRLPAAFPRPAPGQFVMVRDAGRRDPLLPRPLSVFGFRPQRDHAILELLYRAVGRGTSLFSGMKSGDPLSVLGPLGRGFTIRRNLRRVLLVAGGVGVAPLSYLLQEAYPRETAAGGPEVTAYLGAGTEELLTGTDRLETACDLRICTDDGSRGYRGPVTGLLKDELGGAAHEETAIYACGPAGMIRELQRLLSGTAISCEVSLEERMACGVGACLGCAVALRTASGGSEYRRVCHDGPVFDIREILFPPSPEACRSGEGS
jgi:dihydroorotate dehydrogenase electron transfer subunit